MRLPFAATCLAVAACQVLVGAHAEPSDTIAKSAAAGQSEVSTNRLLMSDKFAEERGITDEVELAASALTKYESGQVKVLMDATPPVEPFASASKTKQLMAFDARTPAVESFASALEKAESELLKDSLNVPSESFARALRRAEFVNLKLLLKGWTPPAESISSDSKSSTERLDHWIDHSEHSPYELFKILRIHKAADEAANSLLVSFNLEKWNGYLKLNDEAGHNGFQQTLLTTLTTYCGDEDRAKVFIDRLSILRRKTDPIELEWLGRKKTPKEVREKMGFVEAKEQLFEWKKWQKWITYVDAFNELYPEQQTTLLAALPYEPELLEKMTLQEGIYYPKQGSPRSRILGEIFESWRNEDVSPNDAYRRLGLEAGGTIDLMGNRFTAWICYMDIFNANRLPLERKVSYMSVLESVYGHNLVKKIPLMSPGDTRTLNDRLRSHMLDGLAALDYLEPLNTLIRSVRKRKATEPPS